MTYKQRGITKYRAVLTVNGTVYQKAGFKTIEKAAEYRKQLEAKYLPSTNSKIKQATRIS